MKIKLIKSILIMLLLASTVQLVQAQNAYVHQNQILAAMQNYQADYVQWDSIRQLYSKDMQVQRNVLQTKLNRLLRPYKPKQNENFLKVKQRMQPTDTLKLNVILDDDRALTQKEKSYQQIVTLEYKKRVQPYIDALNKVMASYAKKKKLNAIYILDQLSPALAYVNPSQVITHDIISLIKKESVFVNKK